MWIAFLVPYFPHGPLWNLLRSKVSTWPLCESPGPRFVAQRPCIHGNILPSGGSCLVFQLWKLRFISWKAKATHSSSFARNNECTTAGFGDYCSSQGLSRLHYPITYLRKMSFKIQISAHGHVALPEVVCSVDDWGSSVGWGSHRRAGSEDTSCPGEAFPTFSWRGSWVLQFCEENLWLLRTWNVASETLCV